MDISVAEGGEGDSLRFGGGAGGPPALSRSALPRRRLQPPAPPEDVAPTASAPARVLAAGDEEDGFRLALVSLAGARCGTGGGDWRGGG